MEEGALRLQIRGMLSDGRLPNRVLPRVAGGPGRGELCDICGEAVQKTRLAIETLTDGGRAILFDSRCFYLWEQERRNLGLMP
jgi:hypothetical protein